jgi:thymidylate synthase
MKQYLDLCERIINEGEWVENERTGKKCLTVINADLTYDVENNKFPLVTTRKSFWKSAVAELLGYIRGYDNAADFREIGTKTWDANANLNESWLNNPHRKGEDDMGRVYGIQGRSMKAAPSELQYEHLNKLIEEGKTVEAKMFLAELQNNTFDQLKKVYNDLKNGIDDRGEIITFWVPTEFDQGCLRPCMFQHHFSLLGDTLYLNSYQRSCDVPLGLNFNMVQVYFFLALMAQITGHKAGKAYHKIVNAHIYEDQYDLMKDVQLKRSPLPEPQFYLDKNIKTLEDVETWVTKDHFTVENYEHHDPIQYPFSV